MDTKKIVRRLRAIKGKIRESSEWKSPILRTSELTKATCAIDRLIAELEIEIKGE